MRDDIGLAEGRQLLNEVQDLRAVLEDAGLGLEDNTEGARNQSLGGRGFRSATESTPTM